MKHIVMTLDFSKYSDRYFGELVGVVKIRSETF